MSALRRTLRSLRHSTNTLPKEPRFYRDQIKKLVTNSSLKNNSNVKEVHSDRLGIGYTVTIRKYTCVLGARNPELKQTVEQTRQKDARKRRHSTVEHHTTKNTPEIPEGQSTHQTNQHVPEKYNYYGRIVNYPHHNELTVNPKNFIRREKNWLRRVKKRNKKKKPLPPLPPGTLGMSRLKQIPTRGTLYRKKTKTLLTIQLRRTPPSDNDSRTTITDNSYASAAESVATVIYPLTPAHE
ncbi:hypothetical protein RhiirA5_384845 [Rhizophagus irregularis]|uniref:Uncharacterized protein n=1 Tax=Rhizophagus irregularis TaxID=588596 RepID=A0A2I1EH15_9GLOM|nr:hypothetical protein RhiirA5_384845 [Rhizophagus irregularis]PKY21403.1 hypothetical protein RhiirB3_385646 [Rhizophagus irregularis]